jgi:hypothetical protein
VDGVGATGADVVGGASGDAAGVARHAPSTALALKASSDTKGRILDMTNLEPVVTGFHPPDHSNSTAIGPIRPNQPENAIR